MQILCKHWNKMQSPDGSSVNSDIWHAFSDLLPQTWSKYNHYFDNLIWILSRRPTGSFCSNCISIQQRIEDWLLLSLKICWAKNMVQNSAIKSFLYNQNTTAGKADGHTFCLWILPPWLTQTTYLLSCHHNIFSVFKWFRDWWKNKLWLKISHTQISKTQFLLALIRGCCQWPLCDWDVCYIPSKNFKEQVQLE